MKPYIKVYMDFFGIGDQDTPQCEICKNLLNDVHHIHLKGMGGRKTFIWKEKTYDIDDIINLIGLCRRDHNLAHNGEHSKSFLMFTHAQRMERKKFSN